MGFLRTERDAAVALRHVDRCINGAAELIQQYPIPDAGVGKLIDGMQAYADRTMDRLIEAGHGDFAKLRAEYDQYWTSEAWKWE